MTRPLLSSLVSRQLPEFVREDYPTFVAFVEAYYEYLQTQGVDFSTIRDIDQTLDTFITEFKKELAYNMPNIIEDERLILQKIKDQYLSKGSAASYKLLFKLLYGKEVELTYPGQQMLRASDGRWNQEISLFAKVDYGSATDIEGKLVDIVTPTRVLRVLVDRRQDLVGEIDRVVALGGNIYEFFLDKKFFGIVSIGDRIKYKDQFQATIIPATVKVKISQPGKGFRIGQVFSVISGAGTSALIKITKVSATGGVLYAEIIKFGIGYESDFAVSVLASNSITSSGANAISSTSNYNSGALTVGDSTEGFGEQGYLNLLDYTDYGYIDGTYVGTLIRQFSLNSKNAQVDAADPAIFEIFIGSLTKYPGYFETNNGFLDDSIYIQDSKYYQAFSYVIKIDERLDSYKSAVKTMVHPSGLALFGEFNITNNLDLSVALESLVKSLGIGLSNDQSVVDLAPRLNISKVLTDAGSLSDFPTLRTTKILQDTLSSPTDSSSITFTKNISPLYGFTQEKVTMADSTATRVFGKLIQDNYTGMTDALNAFSITKPLADTSYITEVPAIQTNKYLLDTSIGTFSESGYLVKNPYDEGGYFAEIYANARDATFSS